MINKSLIFLFIFSYLLITPIKAKVELDTSKIKNYFIIKEFYLDDKNRFMAIRSYEYNANKYYLIVNLDTLKTSIITENKKKNLKKTTEKSLLKTNYNILKEKALKNSIPLANAGINESLHKNNNEIYLTIDMCPSSKKGYEKELFEEFLNLNESKKKIPIAIAITYRWVKDHKKEFFSLIHNQNLDITWINHSTNHYYNPKEELSNNFMLNSKTNLEEEIIEVEKMLILNKQIPSVLFRFPGLISDKNMVVNLVNKFTLIPIGTNNWLVKSKRAIMYGDIILIHGNLNEKEGVIKLIKNYHDLKLFKPIYNSLLTQ